MNKKPYNRQLERVLRNSLVLGVLTNLSSTIKCWCTGSLLLRVSQRLDGPGFNLRFDTSIIYQKVTTKFNIGPESSFQFTLPRDWQPNVLLLITCVIIFVAVYRRLLPDLYLGPVSFVSVGIFVIAPMILLLLAILHGSDSILISRPLAYLFLFSAYAGISIIWSPSPASGISVLTAVGVSMCIIFSLYLTSSVDRSTEIHLSFLFVITLIILAIVGWEYATHTHLSVSRLSTSKYQQFGNRLATGLWWNSNDLGFYLCLAAPILYGYRTSRHWKIFGSFTTILILGILLQNGSRAALLGVFIGIISYTMVQLLSQYCTRDIKFKPRIFTIGLLSLSIFVVASSTIEPPVEILEHQSIWIRWQLQRATVSMLQDSLGIGTGIGGFDTIVATSPISTLGVHQPHSWLLRLLGEYGIFGTVCFLLALGLTLDRLFYKSIASNTNTAAILFASLLSFVFVGLGPSKPLIGLYMFWIVFGLGITETTYSTVFNNSQSDCNSCS